MRVIWLRPVRQRPKIGDVKIIKGVRHVRVFKLARDASGKAIGLDRTGGRQRYEWEPAP